MGVHSGQFGVVHKDGAGNAATFMRGWTYEDAMTPETYYASNTRAGQFANSGVVDGSGTFNGFGGFPGADSRTNPVPGDTLLFPGDTFTFWGYTAPSNDLYGSDGNIYKVSAIVDSIELNWGWEAGQSLNWTINFSASPCDGQAFVIEPGFIDDVNNKIPEKMCGLKVSYNDDSTVDSVDDTGYSDWDNVVSATMNISAQNQEYVNSSTNCDTCRKPGVINWTLGIVEQEEDQLTDRTKGTNNRLRLYVNATEYWLLQFGLLQDYTGLAVDRETGDIIQKTANYIMNGSNGTLLGTITPPGGADRWPKAPTP